MHCLRNLSLRCSFDSVIAHICGAATLHEQQRLVESWLEETDTVTIQLFVETRLSAVKQQQQQKQQFPVDRPSTAFGLVDANFKSPKYITPLCAE